jgi:hypothetical protein
MFNARLLFILMMPLAANASTLYRCTDDVGRTTYTNYKASNRKCQVLSRDDEPTRAPSPESKPAAKTSPADFPRVSMDTQKSRDGDRRYILEQELSAENKHLEEARKALAEKLATPAANAPSTQLQPLRDRIALHERNLDALRREMSNLK